MCANSKCTYMHRGRREGGESREGRGQGWEGEERGVKRNLKELSGLASLILQDMWAVWGQCSFFLEDLSLFLLKPKTD